MYKISVLFSLCILLIFACEKEEPVIQTEFLGPKISIGNGQAWTFVQTDEQQEPISIGIQFDESALENLPSGSTHADEFMLALPDEIQVAPYNHVTLDWNEHGHEPMHVYDLPHFDMHFYFMSEDQRNQIGPFDSIAFNKPLPAEYLAPAYLETPGGVPRMGAHIIDLMSPEVAGTGIFTHTFIYGKYDARINFLEPMVTKDFLDSKMNMTQAIRQPAQWQRAGYYPESYLIEYDAAAAIYTISLYNLQKVD